MIEEDGGDKVNEKQIELMAICMQVGVILLASDVEGALKELERNANVGAVLTPVQWKREGDGMVRMMKVMRVMVETQRMLREALGYDADEVGNYAK